MYFFAHTVLCHGTYYKDEPVAVPPMLSDVLYRDCVFSYFAILYYTREREGERAITYYATRCLSERPLSNMYVQCDDVCTRDI